MPLHPAPPTDLPGLVEAYRQSVQAVIDLGLTSSQEDFEQPTDCPGWTVQDQISHIVGVESWLSGAQPPVIELPDLPHVKNEMGAFMELWVHDRRSMEGRDVAGELVDVLTTRLGQLTDPELTADTPLRGIFGLRPARETLVVRIIDIWVHEQDIRNALRRPGNLDSPGASLFVSSIMDALPMVVTKRAKVPIGQAVIVDITGPVLARTGVVVVEQDGKPRGERLFSGDVTETPKATTTIVLSTDAVTRLAAGRREVDDIPHTVHGNEEVARAVLENLSITP